MNICAESIVNGLSHVWLVVSAQMKRRLDSSNELYARAVH